MTVLVHTADVHLRPDAAERLDALEAVLDTATDVGADVLTIGGDLFDRPEDVDDLRSVLRNRLFSDRSFEILLLPGNHDVEAFRGDLFFGDACTVIADEEHFGTWISGDGELKVVGIPYRSRLTDDLLLALDARGDFDGTEVLLFHGSLDAPIGADTGDEDEYRYFPVTAAVLDELGFDWYLAGHYHDAHHLHFESGSGFAYPGTPASTRTSETGRRRVVRLDTEAGFGFEPLDTFHYLERHVTVIPGTEDAVLRDLGEWVETAVSSDAEPRIVVGGVVDLDEGAFANALSDVANPDWVTNETVSVSHVASHPVLESFEERLAEQGWDDETTAAVWTRTLRVAGQVATSGGFD